MVSGHCSPASRPSRFKPHRRTAEGSLQVRISYFSTPVTESAPMCLALLRRERTTTRCTSLPAWLSHALPFCISDFIIGKQVLLSNQVQPQVQQLNNYLKASILAKVSHSKKTRFLKDRVFYLTYKCRSVIKLLNSTQSPRVLTHECLIDLLRIFNLVQI